MEGHINSITALAKEVGLSGALLLVFTLAAAFFLVYLLRYLNNRDKASMQERKDYHIIFNEIMERWNKGLQSALKDNADANKSVGKAVEHLNSNLTELTISHNSLRNDIKNGFERIHDKLDVRK